jgi:PAS domain S-box-containing protein
MKLLLVEDEYIIAAAERFDLEALGHEVLCAGTGKAAVSLIEAEPSIELVLMDIDLGQGMDGTEAAAEILRNHDLPLIFVSSHAEKAIVEKTERITNYGYVVKNSSPTVLDASIKMAVKLFEAQRRNARINMELGAANEALRVTVESLQEANEALARSEEKFFKAFHTYPDAVMIARYEDGVIVDLNEGFTEITGYGVDEAIGRSTLSSGLGFWTDAADRDRLLGPLRELGRVEGLEGAISRKNGRKVDCMMSAEVLDVRGEKFILAIAKDVSASKERDQLLTTLFQKSVVPMLLVDPATTVFVDVNEAACSFYGYPRERMIGSDAHLVSAGPRAEVDARLRRTVRGEESHFFFNHRLASGEVREVEVFASPITFGGRNLIHSLVLDVTENRRAEARLRESEFFFRESQRAAAIGSYKMDLLDGYWTSSAVLDEIFGIGEDYERTEAGWLELVHPEDRAMMRDYFDQEVAGKGLPFNKEYRLVRKSTGETRWVLGLGRVTRDEAGRTISLTGTIQDVTGRKEDTLALELSEKALVRSQRTAHVGSWTWHVKTERLEWSDEMYRIFGLDPERSSGQLAPAMAGSVHPDDRAKVEAANRSVEVYGRPQPLEYRILRPDGSLRTVWSEAGELVRDQEGKPERLSGIVLDITSYKEKELELERAAKRFKAIMAATADGFLECAFDGKLLDANPAFCDMTGYSLEELLSMSIGDLDRTMDSEERKARLLEIIELGHIAFDTRHRRKDGSEIEVSLSIARIETDGPTLACFCRDISERNALQREKQAFDARLIGERETLLLEMRHRMTNNLSIIAGYLSLRMAALEDAEALAAIQDGVAQAQGMIALFESLYSDEFSDTVDARLYLRSLLQRIEAALGGMSGITVVVESCECALGSKEATTLGIIVNEFVTNSFKYAFKDVAEPRILVTLREAGDRFVLRYEDNGPGPLAGKSSGSGFGMRLIRSLVQQLGAVLSAGPGAAYEIEFVPEPPRKP